MPRRPSGNDFAGAEAMRAHVAEQGIDLGGSEYAHATIGWTGSADVTIWRRIRIRSADGHPGPGPVQRRFHVPLLPLRDDRRMRPP